MNYIWINEETAKQKGISDGVLVQVEAESTGLSEGIERKIKAKARLSQGVHPQVIGICRSMGGWGRNSVQEGMWTENLAPTYMLLRPNLTQYLDGVTDALENCVKVKVTKVS
jgi:anaerobic selenocysteine-containing dehydrogenase